MINSKILLMKIKYSLLKVSLIITTLTLLSFRTFDDKPVALLNQMIAKNDAIQTLEYNMTGKERIKGKIIEKRTYLRINLRPYKVYFKQKIVGIDVEGFLAHNQIMKK